MLYECGKQSGMSTNVMRPKIKVWLEIRGINAISVTPLAIEDSENEAFISIASQKKKKQNKKHPSLNGNLSALKVISCCQGEERE